MLNSTTLVKPASMTERVWFLLLLLSSVSQVVDSGVCISPQASWAPYCQPSYQVYALYESARTDVNYWLQLDQQAQAQATQWKNTLGCDDSAITGKSWCKNYACALSFPKCDTTNIVPLPVCRQTCKDCFRTCSPDRSILPPSMYASKSASTWTAAYSGIEYDLWSKAYICEADNKLADGGRSGLLYFGAPCTGSAASSQFSFLLVALLPLLTLARSS
mmetsp:Transcript_23423/g.76154  ORF Transcript_23423/g.76154 Transcript_23423/m.76154 type:complete len:218 (-) Transcript_23423:153-806(-)